MSEQKKAIDITPEELKQWLSFLTLPKDDEIPCYYFSASDPYLKHEPMQENRTRRNIRFDENGNIAVKNISAYWIPDLAVTEEISGTIYTITGSYEGENSLIPKLERIASRKFTNQLGQNRSCRYDYHQRPVETWTKLYDDQPVYQHCISEKAVLHISPSMTTSIPSI